jgi:putative FmdB family regulatory protein
LIFSKKVLLYFKINIKQKDQIMPIFEYQCSKCDEVFEKIVFRGEEDDIRCPKCKSSDIHKKMSATSFMGSSIGTCASDAPKGFS